MSGEASGRRLGRGLSALLGDQVGLAAPATELAAGPVQDLPIEQLVPNKDQPRKRFDEQDLAALADSIAEHGILQPILVRPAGPNLYEIIAGERRWRAAQKARLHSAPVRVLALDDKKMMEAAIIENVQRQDLNPLEEAAGYRALMDAFHHTQESLAKVVGKSRSHVANMLRLLSLPAEVRRYVEENRLSMGHARALLNAEDAAALARDAVEKGWSVREVEKRAQSADRKAAAIGRAVGKAAAERPDADRAALEADLSSVLGMTVGVKDRGGRGELTVRFASYEQLDELCRRLMRAKREA